MVKEYWRNFLSQKINKKSLFFLPVKHTVKEYRLNFLSQKFIKISYFPSG